MLCISHRVVNGHQYLGDFGYLMIVLLNNYHLRHKSRRFDCAIKLFRQQTLREMTCSMRLCTAEMLSGYNQTLSPLALGEIKLMRYKTDRIRPKSTYDIDNLNNIPIT